MFKKEVTPGYLADLDPRRRRVLVENYRLQALARRLSWLTITPMGPSPMASQFLLEADVIFPEVAANPDGYRLQKGDRTLMTLPGEFPDAEPLFLSLGSRRFHPNMNDDALGLACLGLVGGYSPDIPLPHVIQAYYALLTGDKWDVASPMGSKAAQEAARAYPGLKRDGRLPFCRPGFVILGKDEGVEHLVC